MKRYILPFIFGVMLLSQYFTASTSEAACASVTIEILQQVTIERLAFDAKLVMNNGVPDQALTNIRLDIIIKDGSGNVKTDLFFIRPPALTGFQGALDGTGSVAAGTKGEGHWLIIPSPGAGFIEENGSLKQAGVDYWVGATLSYTVNGQQETVPVIPAKITVKPMPQLVLDYFMPSNVFGDNPFTPQAEAPIPYSLALRVLNDGYGPANNLRIDSAQAVIKRNQSELLIAFKLLGASVNDSVVLPSLTVNFGDLPSKRVSTANWRMISTLSGRFVDFKTSFTHSSELGGDLTSLIKSTNPHFLTHMVKVNLPGRDSRLDFLADVNTAYGYIFESEIPNGSSRLEDARSQVTVVSPLALPSRPTPQAPSVAVALPTGASGWIYTKLADPSQGLLKLIEVTRADGVKLDPNNFWVDEGLDGNYRKIWTLQFVDYRADAATPGAYTLKFTTPDADTVPPSTSLVFAGPVKGSDPFYITPQTQMILSPADNDGGSGVDAMYKKVSGVDSVFVPAFPFTIDNPGSHTVEYYSTDRAGNVEATKTASVVVVGSAPSITAFIGTPTSFSPQAPRGVKATRSIEFSVTATSTAATLPTEIAIAPGTTFQADKVIRTLKGDATPATALKLTWDGKDASGKPVQSGSYVARVKVLDGLDNPADNTAPNHTDTRDATLTAVEWFAAGPIDPHPEADQLHPRVSGSKVVWQDMRNGKWDIYLKDLTGGASTLIPGTSADREFPAIDGNTIVWQDLRSGNWEIYGYDLAAVQEIPIAAGTGDKEHPAISGTWVVWQDKRSGNWDIYAKNLSSSETIQITNHERDQLHPAIAGNVVVWEDYRNGLGEIYSYDLSTRTETRITFDQTNQTQPSASGSTLVWTDERNGQKDIYSYEPAQGALRITYGTGDHNQASILGNLLVYTDYESGVDDPNLSFRLLSSDAGDRLVIDPARQEEPAIGDKVVLWQDNRGGKYQIYEASIETEEVPIEVTLRQGHNLVAVGGWLATQYPTASSLLAAKGEELGIERMAIQDPTHNTFTEATAATGDFSISKGTALVLYAQKPGVLKLAESGETASFTLLPGTNQIGILTVPSGYGAYDLMKSVGLDNIQSVRRFDNTTGSWQTAAVRTTASGNSLLGMNFTIKPGDGLVITMKTRVDGWQP